MAGTKEVRALHAAILADRRPETITTPTSLDNLLALLQAVSQDVVVRNSLQGMLSSLALAFAFAIGVQRKGKGVPLPVEWLSGFRLGGPRPNQPKAGSGGLFAPRLASQDDDSSETGVPPPPLRLATRRSGWHHPPKWEPVARRSAKAADPLQNCTPCLKALRAIKL
jgi:hypothetical protein